jgi:hypothetical protein
MRKVLVFLLLAALLSVPTFSVSAQFTTLDSKEVTFTKKDFKDQVTFSSAFTLTDEGLVFQPVEGQTDQVLRIESRPIPTPSSIRPPGSFSMWLDISTSLPNEKLKNVRFRYSSDFRHWSEWQPFSDKIESVGTFKGRSGDAVSNSDSWNRYLVFRNEWIRTNPQDPNDENECSHWIVRQDSSFFEKEKPFVGYVQYSFEFPSDSGPISVQHIELSTMSTTGGLFSGTIVTEKSKKNKKPKVISDNLGKILTQSFAGWSFDYNEALSKAGTPANKP